MLPSCTNVTETSLDHPQLVSCLQLGRDVPQAWVDWPRIDQAGQSDHLMHDCQLISIVYRFVRLRAAFKRHEAIDYRTLSSTIFTIEADLKRWSEDIPPVLAFETIDQVESLDPCYGGKYHTYRDLFVTKTWNSYRIARIYANEFILSYLLPKPDLSSPTSAQLVESTSQQRLQCLSILLQMATDICYSVPMHLHYDDSPRPIDNTEYNLAQDPQTNGMISLLWSLGAAALTVATPSDMSAWCLGVIEDMADRTGNNFALLMAMRVKAGRKLVEASIISI